jgi:hypothetical protein
MRKTTMLLLISLASSAMLFTSCTKDDSTPNNTTDTTLNTAAIVSGTWVISSYTQRTETKTSDYAGMVFSFSADGKVAVTGTATANGTWTYAPPSAGYYGGPASLATFAINIPGSQFNRLSRRAWNVGSQSSTSILLNYPEPGDDEHVTFTKR